MRKRSSSSSFYSRAAASKRLDTIFKKAYEVCTLCDIEACVIHYGPDGELKTWPEDRERVRDMALRYIHLEESKRRKKSFDLCGFLNKKETTLTFNKTNLQKKANQSNPNSVNTYSPDQKGQLLKSMELNYSKLEERLRLVESRIQTEANTYDHHHHHQGLVTPPVSLNLQKQEDHHHHHQGRTDPISLNPSQFSLFLYNHKDATISQIPLPASDFSYSAPTTCIQEEDYSELLESELQQHLFC